MVSRWRCCSSLLGQVVCPITISLVFASRVSLSIWIGCDGVSVIDCDAAIDAAIWSVFYADFSIVIFCSIAGRKVRDVVRVKSV